MSSENSTPENIDAAPPEATVPDLGDDLSMPAADVAAPPSLQNPPVIGDDRRNAPRKIYVTRILVLQQNGRLFEGKTVDISESGLSLIAPFNLVANEQCRMRFQLMTGKVAELLEIDAKIVYSVYQSTKGFKVGMQFSGVAEGQRALIRQFVSAVR